MAQNPWAVDSIKAFYFLKCPECDFDTKEENSFETHATKNHPQSFALFVKKCVVQDFDTCSQTYHQAIFPYLAVFLIAQKISLLLHDLSFMLLTIYLQI